MKPDVTAVIVSWNTREHLARCLAALMAAAGPLELETIVVDNGSVDASQAMVADKFPHVRLIQNADNVGFGRACNVGAAAGTGRAVLLLNSDCELRAEALTTLVAALDADPAVGAVFARLTNADGTLQPSIHASLPTPWGQAADVAFASSLTYALYRAPALKRLLLRGTARHHARAHDVAWGGAACVLVRRAAFEAVNGFDERFFLFMEDVDLCARLGAAGFRLRYEPAAAAVHHWGVSASRAPGRALRHAYLSRIAYFEKHFPRWGGAVAAALASLELAVRTATFGLAARLTGRTAWRARAEASAACRTDVRAAPRARLAGGAALVIIVALVAAHYAGDVLRMAAESRFIDFAHYYTYAVVVRLGGHPLDPAAVAPVDAALGLRRAGAPGNAPPLFYLLMQPWTLLPFRGAALAWLALNQALLAAATALALRAAAAPDPWRVAAAVVVVLTSQPLIETLFLGQVNVALLCLVSVAWWAARSARAWTAACALGAIVHVKPQFAALIPALWWMGHPAGPRAALVALAGVGVGLAAVGADDYVEYVRYVGALPSHYHATILNLAPHATLHRLLDAVAGPRVVETLALLVTGALALAVATRLPRRATGPALDLGFALALTAVPLLSPITEEHHLVVLLLPLLLLLGVASEAREGITLAAAAVLIGARYSFDRWPALHSGVPSLLTTGKLAGVILLAWLLARRLRETTR